MEDVVGSSYKSSILNPTSLIWLQRNSLDACWIRCGKAYNPPRDFSFPIKLVTTTRIMLCYPKKIKVYLRKAPTKVIQLLLQLLPACVPPHDGLIWEKHAETRENIAFSVFSCLRRYSRQECVRVIKDERGGGCRPINQREGSYYFFLHFTQSFCVTLRHARKRVFTIYSRQEGGRSWAAMTRQDFCYLSVQNLWVHVSSWPECL